LPQQYEYKFVRIGEGWLGVRQSGRDSYQKVVHEHAAEGWRLVQVFAPSIGVYGDYELIFERPVSTGRA
jgi:hypothetical protein